MSRMRSFLETLTAVALVVAGVLILRYVVYEGEGPLSLAWGGIWLSGIPPVIWGQRHRRPRRERV